MAPLCTPLPGESLPARARRYAELLKPLDDEQGFSSWTHLRKLLTEMADRADQTYDDRQRAAQLVVCGQCGHQVYSTVKAEG